MCTPRERILVFENGARKYNLANDDWEYTYEIDNERLVVSTTKSEAQLESYTRDSASAASSPSPSTAAASNTKALGSQVTASVALSNLSNFSSNPQN